VAAKVSIRPESGSLDGSPHEREDAVVVGQCYSIWWPSTTSHSTAELMADGRFALTCPALDMSICPGSLAMSEPHLPVLARGMIAAGRAIWTHAAGTRAGGPDPQMAAACRPTRRRRCRAS
jgi:hypothetical protein